MDTNTHLPALDPEHRLADARALDARLVAARGAQRAAEHQLALLLAEMAEDDLFRVLGYISLENYAFVALEITWRTARDLLRVGRCLPSLPVLNAAMAAGQIDWTKARELVRVITPETEPTWVARAKAMTSRVLEREVAAANPGDAAPAGNPAPDRIPARSRVWFDVDAQDLEALHAAFALLRSRSDLNRSEIEDGALLGAMARAAIAAEEAGAPDELPVDARDTAPTDDAAPADAEGTGAQPARPGSSPDERAANTGERYRVVVYQCPGCQKVTAPEGDVSDTIAAEALCDAEIVDLRPGPNQGHATRAIAPALRRRVLHRARWHCEVPGCRNRLWLDVHHSDPWATSKKHEYRKLIVLCSAHHRATHDGVLAVELHDVAGHADGAQCCVVEHADGRRLVGPARENGNSRA